MICKMSTYSKYFRKEVELITILLLQVLMKQNKTLAYILLLFFLKNDLLLIGIKKSYEKETLWH